MINNGHKIIYKDACSSCAGKKTSEVSWKRRASENFALLKEVCAQNDYKLITKESEYTDVKMNIAFECPKHGIQTMMLDNFKRGHKCKFCSYEERGESIKVPVLYIDEVIKSTNDNIWLNPDEHTNTTDHNLKIKCSCGNIYTTSFVNFLRANINRCPICSQKESSGEFKIRKYLEENNIDFEQEKRFSDCRDTKPLSFDFYLPNNNMCIEFDGKQHYSDVFGDESFIKTKLHDDIKDKYCEKNKISMLRIPYWEYNKIENILSSYL